MTTNKKLLFLKLGGSLITDKHTPSTARPDVIRRACEEIAQAISANPRMRLIVGHGSGSFGHMAAKQYHTRQGVHTPAEWRGFANVWKEARALNQIVVEALHAAGLPAMSFPASSGAAVCEGQVEHWDLSPLHKALEANLLPVVYGDVVFDNEWGGTILSTEDIFRHLAHQLAPSRILLAGIEQGVWADYPANTMLAGSITPANINRVLPALQGSAAADVTGGMRSKVEEMLALASQAPGLEVYVFSGVEAGAISNALCGEVEGTQITA